MLAGGVMIVLEPIRRKVVYMLVTKLIQPVQTLTLDPKCVSVWINILNRLK